MISAIVNVITSIFGYFKDKSEVKRSIKIAQLEAKEAAFRNQIELAKVNQARDLAQIQVNQNEAQSKLLFVAGWRPFIGWGLGVIMIFNDIIFPLLVSLGVNIPRLDFGEQAMLLSAILGTSGLRSYDKYKGNTVSYSQVTLPPPEQTK